MARATTKLPRSGNLAGDLCTKALQIPPPKDSLHNKEGPGRMLTSRREAWFCN